jgi:hypothetical protein
VGLRLPEVFFATAGTKQEREALLVVTDRRSTGNSVSLIALHNRRDAPPTGQRPIAIPNSETDRKSARIAPARKIIMAANKPADDKKPKVEDTSHKPAKHIVETARLASSVEKAKNPGKVRGTKD